MGRFKAGKADTVFSFLSFGVFAVSMLISLVFGINVYRSVIEKPEGGGGQEALSYIWTKIKTADTADNIMIEEFCGLPSLCLYEEYEGTTYKTMIYEYDGWVYELYSEAGLEFLPIDGARVIEAESLELEYRDGGLIKVSVNSEEMFIFPRGKVYTFAGR